MSWPNSARILNTGIKNKAFARYVVDDTDLPRAFILVCDVILPSQILNIGPDILNRWQNLERHRKLATKLTCRPCLRSGENHFPILEYCRTRNPQRLAVACQRYNHLPKRAWVYKVSLRIMYSAQNTFGGAHTVRSFPQYEHRMELRFALLTIKSLFASNPIGGPARFGLYRFTDRQRTLSFLRIQLAGVSASTPFSAHLDTRSRRKRRNQCKWGSRSVSCRGSNFSKHFNHRR